MTIEQAIEKYDQFANVCKYHGLTASQEEFEQLAAWLRELQERRKNRDYWREKAHSYEQTIYKLTDAISKQPEIIFCKDCAKQYKPTCPFGVWINTPDDGHCHWAERRTDEKKQSD